MALDFQSPTGVGSTMENSDLLKVIQERLKFIIGKLNLMFSSVIIIVYDDPLFCFGFAKKGCEGFRCDQDERDRILI